MNSIEIDDQVLLELSRRAVGFHVAPNDVLRRILDLDPPVSPQALAIPSKPTPPTLGKPVAATLPEFITSERFQRFQQTIDRYLVILGWLHEAQPKEFADAALGFKRGKRHYFAKSEKEIVESGDGITAKPIPRSPFWTLATLDNKSKRIVLDDLLQALGYAREEIVLALAQLPDSGIRRGHGRARPIVCLYD